MSSGREFSVTRILFSKLEDGDLKKFRAQSNDAPTGGGARDLRFSPNDEFWPFFQRMFLDQSPKNHDSEHDGDISADIKWRNPDGTENGGKMVVKEPTESRKNECRIARIHSYGLDTLIPTKLPVFMMFSLINGDIRIEFTTQQSLQNDDWHSEIKKIIESEVYRKRKSTFWEYSADGHNVCKASEILKLLESHHNVLLAGPPGTGKSRLLSEVAHLFEARGINGLPEYKPESSVPIPNKTGKVSIHEEIVSDNRKVFRCVFHQSSKHRDFITGMIPDVSKGAAPGTFRITDGVLYRASQHAKKVSCSSLVIIDEINRGPAVQIFGGSIVAFESDKRLGPDGARTPTTQFFDLINPDDGNIIEYAFPHRLFILAAMNQADVSVEPIDVAFLRRWVLYALEPDSSVLRKYFDLGMEPKPDLPEKPEIVDDIYEAAVQAFDSINERIAIGRGREFMIGHGVLMSNENRPGEISDALDFFANRWRAIKAHIDETFFGDVRGTSIILNLGLGTANNPYKLKETSFGGISRSVISGPTAIKPEEIYSLFLALIKNG